MSIEGSIAYTVDLERRLQVAQEALNWAWEMFKARDEMNAKVHCAPVRYSPLTERVKQALDATYKRLKTGGDSS